MLLKVNTEYLRRTLPVSKKTYQESVEALKVLSIPQTKSETSADRPKQQAMAGKLIQNSTATPEKYNQVGYRSNELDEK
jgi:hypothetical protein